HLELRAADVDAAVGLQPRAELQLEVEVLVELPDGVQVADAALAGGVLDVHDDDPVLDLDALVQRFRLAVERLPLLAGILPAGQVVDVEQADVAGLRLEVVGRRRAGQQERGGQARDDTNAHTMHGCPPLKEWKGQRPAVACGSPRNDSCSPRPPPYAYNR